MQAAYSRFLHVIDEIVEYGGLAFKMIYPYIDKIRKIRINHHLSQEDVARILGTSQTMYSRYERGASEMPIRYLVMLADYYNISADYILGRSDIV